jgi:hypothetical protein
MHARYVRGFPFHSTPGYSRAVPTGTQKIRTPSFLFPLSYFLFPLSYFLFPISYFLFPISYFLFPISYFLFPISYFLFPLSYFHLPVFPDCQLPGGVPGSFHKKATDPFGSVAGFDGSRRLIV